MINQHPTGCNNGKPETNLLLSLLHPPGKPYFCSFFSLSCFLHFPLFHISPSLFRFPPSSSLFSSLMLCLSTSPLVSLVVVFVTNVVFVCCCLIWLVKQLNLNNLYFEKSTNELYTDCEVAAMGIGTSEATVLSQHRMDFPVEVKEESRFPIGRIKVFVWHPQWCGSYTNPWLFLADYSIKTIVWVWILPPNFAFRLLTSGHFLKSLLSV